MPQGLTREQLLQKGATPAATTTPKAGGLSREQLLQMGAKSSSTLAPTVPVEQSTDTGFSGENVVKGVAKGLGRTGLGIGTIGRSIQRGVVEGVGLPQSMLGGESVFDKTGEKRAAAEKFLTSKGTTQKVAGIGTDIVTAAIPGAAAFKATRSLPIAAKLAGRAGVGGLIGTIQDGGNVGTGTAVGAGLEAGLPVLGQILGKTVKYGVSQSTGLNAETIKEIIKNPAKYGTTNDKIREETANFVGEALNKRLDDLSEVGKGYEKIREMVGNVQIPENVIPNVLSKFGVKLDDAGKIVTTAESRPLSPADRNGLQEFIDNYGKMRTLSQNAFMNTREALSNMSKFEQGKTGLSERISKAIRAEYDALGKNQIPGLKELDARYAPEIKVLKQLKKDIFDKDGQLKDSAISKIANLTNKGREKVLARLEQLVPDIAERARVIKAMEDITAAGGQKVGTYARAGLGIGGISIGNPMLIIGAILSQPEIAVPLLRSIGYGVQGIKKILPALPQKLPR